MGGPPAGAFPMRSRNATSHGAARSIATFVVVLVVGSFCAQELFSHFTAKGGAGPGAGVPEKVISDRVDLKQGQVMRYDVVLRVGARLKIVVRSSRVPISVKLVSAKEPSPGVLRSRTDESGPTAPQPVFWQRDTLGITKVETLTAGKWTLFIEASEEPVGKRHLETTITTEVSVL